jgi:hypothetical protein
MMNLIIYISELCYILHYHPVTIPLYADVIPSILIKSIEPYSFTKDTLREEVCLRLINPTTQVYLGNVELLTRPLTCSTIVQIHVQWEGRPNIILFKALKL